jgi:dienelactone hydrolase
MRTDGQIFSGRFQPTGRYGQLGQFDVPGGGIAGRFFGSAGQPRGAVIVLGGSGGGIGWSGEVAAQLAFEGYAALALAYFRWPGVAKHLAGIRLEYVADAIRWMQAQVFGAARPVTLVGASRGAELALLAASTFSEVGAVIAVAPSSVSWGPDWGFGTTGRAAWTYREQALPGMSLPRALCWGPTTALRAMASSIRGTPWRVTPAILDALRDANAVARAAIPVERIRGPVLLVSGVDDQIWPSAAMGECIRSRLAATAHPFEVRHLSYDGAGHAVSILSTDSYPKTARHPITRLVYDLGGSDSVNRTASESARTEALNFLSRHLDNKGPPDLGMGADKTTGLLRLPTRRAAPSVRSGPG